MSRPYGPIPLTAGIVTSQDIDGVSGAWVVIRNDSVSLDLGVSFQVNPPAAVSIFSGRPWEGVIPAGGSGTFKLPDDTIWRGRIWLCPVDVSGMQAATGTISGYSRAYVRVFDIGEDPQTESSVVRALDIVSQPRVVSIPMTPFFCTSQQLQLNTGANAGMFPQAIAVTNPNTDVGCYVYIYYASVSTSATAGAATFSVRLEYLDNNTFAILGQVDFIFGMIGQAANVGDQWMFNPSVPFAIPLVRGSSLPANTGIIQVDIHCQGATVANYPVLATLMIDSDKASHVGSNPVSVPGIGGGAQPDIFTGTQPKY